MSSNSRVDRRGFLRNAGRTVLGATAAGGPVRRAALVTLAEAFRSDGPTSSTSIS